MRKFKHCFHCNKMLKYNTWYRHRLFRRYRKVDSVKIITITCAFFKSQMLENCPSEASTSKDPDIGISSQGDADYCADTDMPSESESKGVLSGDESRDDMTSESGYIDIRFYFDVWTLFLIFPLLETTSDGDDSERIDIEGDHPAQGSEEQRGFDIRYVYGK